MKRGHRRFIRIVFGVVYAVGLCLHAGRGHAAPVDVGTFWININDSVGLPAPFFGEASFAGTLAAANPIALSGSIQSFTFGPPGGGFGDFQSLQQSGNPGDLQWATGMGTFLCPTAGCNSGQDVSFVGTVTSASGTLIGLLPANSTYTGDGAGHLVASIPGVPACNPPAPNHRCFQGTTGFNAFQNVPTPQSSPPGSPVTVSASTTYYNPLSGLTVPITTDVTFKGGVSAAGATTTFSTVSNSAGVLSSNFATAVGTWQAQYTDVVVDPPGAYAGPVIVCSSFDGSGGYIGNTGVSVCDLHILHNEGGTFQDRTLAANDPDCPLAPVNPCPGAARCIDPDQNRICGESASLSFFTVAPFVGDTDGDGLLDTVDPCTRITSGQVATKAKAVLKRVDLPFGEQSVVWKGTFTPEGDAFTMLDVLNRGVHLRLDDAACLGLAPEDGYPFDVSIPPVQPGCDVQRDVWKVNNLGPGSGDFTYSNKSGFLDGACTIPAGGITKVVLKDKRSRNGGVKFAVTAKNVVGIPLEYLGPPCQLYGSVALAAQPGGGKASDEAMGGVCGEFTWTFPPATAKPAPYCTLKPAASPKTETCVGP